MTATKTIGVVFIDRFADWEYGLLSAAAADWFDVRAISLAPGGRQLRSAAGFVLEPERDVTPEENSDLDAVAVIGSDEWTGTAAPDVTPLLAAAAKRDGVIGGICAGTLALAKAGLFRDADHTSNGRDWILAHLPGYAGAARYQDVPHAVADGRIISAPGSAPATFAHAFLLALFPENSAQLDEMRTMFAREHGVAGS